MRGWLSLLLILGGFLGRRSPLFFGRVGLRARMTDFGTLLLSDRPVLIGRTLTCPLASLGSPSRNFQGDSERSPRKQGTDLLRPHKYR